MFGQAADLFPLGEAVRKQLLALLVEFGQLPGREPADPLCSLPLQLAHLFGVSAAVMRWRCSIISLSCSRVSLPIRAGSGEQLRHLGQRKDVMTLTVRPHVASGASAIFSRR